MKTLTYEQATELAEAEIAKEGANYVYPQMEIPGGGNCQYFRDGEPSCIVGRILAELDVPEKALAHNLPAWRALGLLDSTGFVTADSKAVDFLQELQMRQDKGMPWGEAYSEAVSKIEEVYA